MDLYWSIMVALALLGVAVVAFIVGRLANEIKVGMGVLFRATGHLDERVASLEKKVAWLERIQKDD